MFLQLGYPKTKDHEYLLKPQSHVTLVKAYYKYMIDIAVILGAPITVITSEELKEALDFEIALFSVTTLTILTININFSV